MKTYINSIQVFFKIPAREAIKFLTEKEEMELVSELLGLITLKENN